MATRYLQLFDLQALAGQPPGSSEWLTVDQAHIDAFTAAIGDHQWIHTASQQATDGPLRRPHRPWILTLSPLPKSMQAAYRIENARVGITPSPYVLRNHDRGTSCSRIGVAISRCYRPTTAGY